MKKFLFYFPVVVALFIVGSLGDARGDFWGAKLAFGYGGGGSGGVWYGGSDSIGQTVTYPQITPVPLSILPAKPISEMTPVELQSEITRLVSILVQLQTQLGLPVSIPGAYNFSRNLTLGSTGSDVRDLQRALNSDPDTLVNISGAGSPGNETTFFGPATRNAVSKFQVKHRISPSVGYFGSLTRAKMNSLFAQ